MEQLQAHAGVKITPKSEQSAWDKALAEGAVSVDEFSTSWILGSINGRNPVRNIIISKSVRDKIDELEAYLRDDLKLSKEAARKRSNKCETLSYRFPVMWNIRDAGLRYGALWVIGVLF